MHKTLIKGGSLMTGADSARILPAVLLVEGEKIAAVGEVAQQRAAEADAVIDCGTHTLMPGLIDCHNHLSLDPTLENYLNHMNDGIPELTIRAVKSMAVDLHSGVTTSRCLGDKAFLDVACKTAQTRKVLPGPRLLIATRGIRAPHGHGFVGYPFSGVENIRQAVRENIQAGADLIKIYLTGTLRSPRGLPHFFSSEEVNALVSEAHQAGLRVATHCIGGSGLDLAVKAGIDIVEHGYFISDDQIKLLRDSESWLVMTPSIFFTDARIRTLPPDLVQGHIDQRPEVGRRMAAAIDAGVKYAVGTDGMHGALAQEIKYLTDFGASPGAAVAAATSNAARVCGLEDQIGTLDVGKIADIIAVDGAPLEDARVLAKVRTVIQAGRVAVSV